ncbi:biopolymer transporter ExbD [Limibacter armeniacum]|uniref:ExbD/TolR family protein n=1 Tax=Limibacter armeniacum TaxID=466084 RepID=UPI002FE6A17D
MLKKKQRANQEVNAGSMADIAFLLLIFFLVTTTIASDKGVAVVLPPKVEQEVEVKMKERNVYNILINSQDQLLANDEVLTVDDLKAKVKAFVLNNGKDPKLSESPQEAVISIKTDRGTSYEMYINVRDELYLSFDEMRAAYLKVPLKEYMEWNSDDKLKEKHKEKLDRARDMIPRKISDAESSDIGG